MIIIPDIHGRTFWKAAVKGRENEEIIFLGDYLDPYPWENISEENVIDNFKEIIEFKKEHPDNVTLLLGNHDFGPYISSVMVGCRTLKNVDICRNLFLANRTLFKIADYRTINGVNYTFSHSAILPEWVEEETRKLIRHVGIFYSIKDNLTLPNIIDIVNKCWDNDDPELYISLSTVGFSRGGYADVGSMVWADQSDASPFSAPFEGWYQIFGHSQQYKDPIIYSYWACLDCRRAFELDDDGEIIPITQEDNLDNYR